MAAAQAKWKADEAERLSEVRRQAEEEMERRLAAVQAQGTGQGISEEDLAAAREGWESEQKNQLAALQAEWRSEQEQRLDEARRTWEMERGEIAADAKTKAEREFDQALAEAKDVWEQESEVKLARMRGAWESELTQRMAEAQAEGEAKDEELNAITRRALVRAKMAEQNASAAKRLSKDGDPRGRPRKANRTPQKQAKSGGGSLGFKHAVLGLSVAGAALAAAAYVVFEPEFDLPFDPQSVTALPEPPVEETAGYPAEAPPNRLFIQPSIVNVRAAASQGSAVVTQLTRTQPVVELERKNGWVLIAWPDGSGQRGWIHSSLLDTKPSNPNQP